MLAYMLTMLTRILKIVLIVASCDQ